MCVGGGGGGQNGNLKCRGLARGQSHLQISVNLAIPTHLGQDTDKVGGSRTVPEEHAVVKL